MLSKSQVIKSIKDLPNEFTIEDIIDRIILLQKIDVGDEQSLKGKTVSTAEAKIRLKKWLK